MQREIRFRARILGDAAVACVQYQDILGDHAGGLLRWPARLLVPVGYLLLVLQGMSEIVKRVGFLLGRIPDPLEQHREPMVDEFLKGTLE
jgi:TRAP-type mannitol/chloroaromatic compound transport system permease small subunit